MPAFAAGKYIHSNSVSTSWRTICSCIKQRKETHLTLDPKAADGTGLNNLNIGFSTVCTYSYSIIHIMKTRSKDPKDFSYSITKANTCATLTEIAVALEII